MSPRVPVLAAAGAAIVALVGLTGTLLSDGPYLSFSALSAWIVLWTVGLFALLLLAPALLHRRMPARDGDGDRRWELTVVAWGAGALAAGAGFAAIAAAEGFATGSALGALALVGLAESGLVAGAVLGLMLTTG